MRLGYIEVNVNNEDVNGPIECHVDIVPVLFDPSVFIRLLVPNKHPRIRRMSYPSSGLSREIAKT